MKEKSESSVILREGAVCDKFKVVCQALNVGTVELKNAVKIGESYFVVKL